MSFSSRLLWRGLNERGGIEAGLTAARLSEKSFVTETASAAARRDFAWAKRHPTADADLFINDGASAEAVLCVMGPHSRALREGFCDETLSNSFSLRATRSRYRLSLRARRSATPAHHIVRRAPKSLIAKPTLSQPTGS